MEKNIITNNWRNEVKEDFANAIVEAKLDEKLRDKLLLSVKNLMRVGNISLTDTDLHNLINTLQSQIDVLKEEQETQADLMQRNRASGVVFSVATETTAGMVKIATDDDLVNGVNAVSMVTPKNLKTYLAKTGGGGTGVPVSDATETTKGVAEIATQDEATDGTDDSRIVTPKKLKTITRDLDSRATRIRNDVDRNTADLVTHRTDIQQNTTDIVSNTASIATIINTIKKGITTTADKLAQSFTVPTVLHDKVEVKGEDTAGHYGYAVAMNDNYLAVSDPVLQEVVIYHRDKNNSKIFNLEDVHKGKKHGDIFVEDGQIYIKRSDGVHLDVFKYDETQATLTFKKVSSINLTATYGNSLAINDDYLIVGNSQAKTALIYEHSGIHWQLVKKLTGGNSFGGSLAVTDKNIIIAETDNKKIEIFDLNYNKVKTLTGGASYSKLISGNNILLAVAETDNSILKIYKDNIEIASKTVKADCLNLKNYKLLVASKTDKKAYIYDVFLKSETGWFTTTETKWAGLPDNTQGYTGYNIAGGQYQLVRPVGTTDTYTKYKGGTWVKNGTWGGVLWYLGGKIGFEKKGDNQWHQVKKINNAITRRGAGISVDNSIVALGFFGINTVEVYELVSGNWQLKGKRLTGTGRFGYSCGLSSDGLTIAIGADDSNYVEVYEFVSGNWQLKGKRLTGTGSFGFSCDLSADGLSVAIGCLSNIYLEVYEFVSGNWQLKGKRLTGTGRFGFSCDLSADGLIVAIGSDDSNYVEVYEFVSGNWQLKGKRLTGTGSFGYSCGLSSDGLTIAIGADASSYVEVYEFVSGNWQLKGKRLTGTGRFGFSCDLSADGLIVAIGSDDSNYVEVYEFVSGNWQLKGKRLTGTGSFGECAVISPDGSFLVAGGEQGYCEVYMFKGSKQLYLETTDGKHYYNGKEVKDDTKFDSIIETVAPLSALPNQIVQANRNIKLTASDLQHQPNKTGNYISLLGTGTATTPLDITKSDTNFTIGNSFGDACAITTDKVLITNKTDSKLVIYDYKGTKEKDIQLETGVGSVIDATDTEAVVGSEKANKFEAISLT